ncbi:PP2C family protein-serine/threonine phosphatase [Paracoccus sp. p3-h83]|uniref:PP2C family protein-serine/threonine phosphatase n=1 Tax=Paracoccus sp. p3-h83 TaxID=3342805 RepID=UPI0035B71360
MVVDDSRMQRHILTLQLEQAGYRVIPAASGAEALSICAQTMPDIILSDWMMPGMTGVELCHSFRQLPRDRHGYFILLTSLTDKRDAAFGLESGADDYLSKPVSGEELLARLRAGERLISVEERLQERNRALDRALTDLRAAHEAIERDLIEARRLQQGLVRDRFRHFGGMDVSLLLRPAGHVGGDLVGAFRINARRFGVYGIDVSGHGVTAALMTARIAGYLSGNSPDQNVALMPGPQGGHLARSPADLAAHLNDLIIEEVETDCYFTLVYADIDMTTGQGRLVQAGHPYPALQRADGTVEFIGTGGLPIGLFAGSRYEEVTFRLRPGDRLFIGSDGITEATDGLGRMLGDQGLSAILQTNARLHGAALLESLTWSVAGYGGGGWSDDISAVCVEFQRGRGSAKGGGGDVISKR